MRERPTVLVVASSERLEERIRSPGHHQVPSVFIVRCRSPVIAGPMGNPAAAVPDGTKLVGCVADGFEEIFRLGEDCDLTERL